MTPAEIGQWVLLGLGTASIITVLYLHARPVNPYYPGPGAVKLLMIWVFGLLLIGLGIWGLRFMSDYTGMLDVLARHLESPTQKTLRQVMTLAAQDDGSPRVRKALVEIALRQPLANRDQVFRSFIKEAKGKGMDTRLLSSAYQRYEAQSQIVEKMSNLTTQELKKLDIEPLTIRSLQAE